MANTRMKLDPSEKWLFTSDTHAYHNSILQFCPNSRQGKDGDEMTELMIKQWNSQVGPNDNVFHLGDVSWAGYKKTKEYLNALNGNIHLILGNHDNRTMLSQIGRFASIEYYREILVDGNIWVLFHYPIFEWNLLHRNSVHLYGHVHARPLPEMPLGKSMDVGVDTLTNMGLYTLEDIKNIMKTRPARLHHDKSETQTSEN